MGREVEAQAQYRGETGFVRALLESDALILRGEVRARVPRSALLGWQVEADDLRVATSEGPLTLTMGRSEAVKWLAALNKPLRTLAEKLGVAGERLWLLADPQDEVLAAALAGIATADAAGATLGIAVLRSADDLDALIAVCQAYPALPVWAINEKGPRAGLPESAIRAGLRATGMVDVKASAISPALSGTRYQRRRT
jgi:hypothetical protein